MQNVIYGIALLYKEKTSFLKKELFEIIAQYDPDADYSNAFLFRKDKKFDLQGQNAIRQS